MEKLRDSNFHSWKQKIELVLGHRDVDEMIDRRLCPDKPPDGTEEALKWLRKDKTARMTIGLTLSDEMLKNVSNTSTALEMWEEICNVHQRHTLLNKLSARRDFYTATMQSGERMLHLTQLEMMMSHSPSIKSECRLLQEEKRRALRAKSHSSKESALVQQTSDSRKGNKKLCTHCGRTNHTEPHCWEKYGRPQSNSRRSSGRHARDTKPTTAAIIATESPKETHADQLDCDYVCLISEGLTARKNSCKSSLVWHIDSGASCHMTFEKSVFISYEKVQSFPVQMGDKSTTTAVGRGDVLIPIICNGIK
eukprot:IDg23077t1